MNAVLSVQGTAVSEETKPSFLSRVFNKKNALKRGLRANGTKTYAKKLIHCLN